MVLQPTHSSLGVASERVLNLEFNPIVDKPIFWVGLLRWALFIIVATLIYVGGIFLYAGSGEVKDRLLRQGETATAELQKGAEALQKMDIETALTNFRLAEKNYSAALGDFAALGQSSAVLAQINLTDSTVWQGQALLLSGKHLAVAGIQLTEAIKPIVSYWGGLTAVGGSLQSAGTEIGQMMMTGTKKVEIAMAEVRLADELLQQFNLRQVSPALAETIAIAQTKTKTFREAVDLLGSLTKQLPNALGFTTPQYYLLLNQNSNELRPTGGFIGSVVLVKIYQGKIEEIAPDTAQRLDGQNKYSDLELPTPLKAVTAYYGIRDANWEPNFPTSVRTIEELYKQAGMGSVNGVIALTPGVVTDMLNVVGQLALPQYGFSLSAANFVEKTQQQIEIIDKNKYNPKQVLVDFVPVLMNRLMNGSSAEMREIGLKLFQRLVNRDVLVYFTNPELEKVATTLGWSGEIKSIGSQDDYLYVVDANLGGNKSSGSIVKEMALSATVQRDASIKNKLNLRYTHAGTFRFPDGINKNYVRIYLPMGSHIIITTGQDEGTQIDIDSSDGKTVVGFWLTIKPDETKDINLEYELPFKLKFVNGEARYQLVMQKQSGSDRTVLSSYLDVPDNMDLAVRGNSEAVRKDMLFSDKLTKDETVSVLIRKYR